MSPSRRSGMLVVLVALGVLLLAEGAVRVLAGPLNEPQVWRDRETAAKAEQMAAVGAAGGAEVVLLGSSMTNAAVDPVALAESLGTARPIYNAALNGASVRSMATWLEEVVLPELRPRLVVLGLSSRELNGGGINQAEELSSFSSSPAIERLTGSGGLVGWIERAVEDASALFRYRTVLRRPLDAFDDTKGPPPATQVLFPFGVLRALHVFEATDYRVTNEFRTRVAGRVLNDYFIGDAELAALADLLETADEAGVEVAVMLMPITADAVAMHPGGAEDQALFDATITTAIDGHRLIDLRPSFEDLALFADPLHLNGRGRHQFTLALASALAD